MRFLKTPSTASGLISRFEICHPHEGGDPAGNCFRCCELDSRLRGNDGFSHCETNI
jgi:hypothetical protein